MPPNKTPKETHPASLPKPDDSRPPRPQVGSKVTRSSSSAFNPAQSSALAETVGSKSERCTMHTSSESRRLPISQEFGIDRPAQSAALAENDDLPKQIYPRFNRSSALISDTPAQSTALAKTDISKPNLQSHFKFKRSLISPPILPTWKKAKRDTSARSHESSASAEVPGPSALISDTPARSTALAKTDVSNPNLQSHFKFKQSLIFPPIPPAW